MENYVNDIMEDVQEQRKARGEALFKANVADQSIIEIGKILIQRLSLFVKSHPELYDKFFKPWCYTVVDVSVSKSKKAFRVRTKRLYGDEVCDFHVLVPFLLLESGAVYMHHRKSYLENKKDMEAKLVRATSFYYKLGKRCGEARLNKADATSVLIADSRNDVDNTKLFWEGYNETIV